MEDIVTINRTKIPEIQPFKKVAPVEYSTFGSRFNLCSQCPGIWSKFPEYSQDFPYPVFKPVICFTGGNIKKILLQSAYISINSYIIIVKNHKYI